jgi:predicted heme/steroid binding protein
MVALLDFSFGNSTDAAATPIPATATIVSAFYIRPDLPGGFLAAGDEPVCPSDCATSEVDAGAEAADGGGASGSAMDGGISQPMYLQPLALVPDGTRVYVGSLLDTAITSLDIGASELSNPARFNLAEKPIGVSRLRLAIDPYRSETVARADGSALNTQGQFLQDRGRFLYAITRDDSIRVISLDQATPVECDANIVASAMANPVQGCFPVGTTLRRPLAQGPGIRIPPDILHPNPDNPPPLPRDISFADLQPIASNTNYQSLNGQFGFVVASSGQVYVLNLAPKGEDTTHTAVDSAGVTETIYAAATHSFRDARDIGKLARTPIAISIAPQRQVIVSDQAFPTTATYSALDGPLIEPFSTDSTDGTTTNWVDYPDLDTVISRSWSVIWEGALPKATRSSGIVKFAADGVTPVLSDTGADFCASDAHRGDVLMFSGCAQNSDCQPDDKFTCRVAVSGARGMCLPIDSTASSNLIQQCGRFMGSRMRYEITQAKGTELTLQVKLDEVPKTTLNPCTKETEKTDCAFDIEHGKLAGATPDGGGVSHAFECIQVYDPTQAPHLDEPPRCVKRCSLNPNNSGDSDCRVGHVCESVPGTLAEPGKGFCVEAPPIDPTCFPQPMTSYSVRAGHSFMVYGSSMPSLSSLWAAADGTCQPLPPADPALVARIPLSAPQCPDSFFKPLTDPASSAKFVQQLPAQAGSNPCLYLNRPTVGTTVGSTDAGAIATGSTDSRNPVSAFFQNPQIRFVLANLDQYAGDLLALQFSLQYGYIPLTVSIPSYEVQLTMGTRIITGPTKTPESPILQDWTQASSYPYLYVVDQGRTALTPGSHGQVLRINPRAGSNELAYFDSTLSGNTPFQLQ